MPGGRESVSLTAGIWGDMAEVSLLRGQLELARERAEAALDAASESQEMDKTAEIHAILARLHEARGDLSAALASVRAEQRSRSPDEPSTV